MTASPLMTLRFELPYDAGLYRITDASSGAFYVGSAASLKRRWYHHRYRLMRGDHPNPRLQAIWNRDPHRLVFAVVELLAGAGRDERLAKEQALLDEARVGSNRQCMNVLAIAGSHEGRKRSAATVAKLREVNRGRTFSPETIAKMRAAKLGGKLTPEHRAKIGERSRGRPGPKHSAERIAKWRRYSAYQVRQVRTLVSGGVPTLTAARSVGMSRDAARRIVAGESYRDV